MAWSNSIAYGATPDGAVVRMNPADVDGDAVTLATEHGARHRRRRRRRDGPRRRGVDDARPQSTRTPGDLTSETVDVDDLTAMPRVAGLDVRVTPAAAATELNLVPTTNRWHEVSSGRDTGRSVVGDLVPR